MSGAPWGCPRCTLENPPDNGRCEACGTNRPQEWVCPECSYTNKANKTCLLCQSPYPSGGGKKWACQKCTLENAPTAKVCAVCATPQSGSKVDSVRRVVSQHLGQPHRRESVGDPSTCKKCTYHNTPAVASCAMCGTPLDHKRGEKELSRCQSFCMDKQAREYEQHVARLIDEFRRHGYEDREFPPSLASLGDYRQSEWMAQKGSRVREWRRPHKMVTRARRWTFATPHPTEKGKLYFSQDSIMQGGLGDCWFLSAVAVVCTRQELISQIFITKEINPAGVYCLRFWFNGVWKPVIVDDILPANEYGAPAFACGRNNELWVCLIEKAYAKLHGSYTAICSGCARDALTDLTGAPCETIDLDTSGSDPDYDLIWSKLESFQDSGCLMAASCGKRGGEREAYRELGLVTNHCYTVLSVASPSFVGVRLLQLRNPWGRVEWKGDWSDHSPLWTPELRRLLNLNSNDGTFWIAFPDFIQYFSSIDICRTHSNWHSTHATGHFSKRAFPQAPTAQFTSSYLFNISEPTWLFASSVQSNQRGASLEYQYKDIGIIIMRQSSGEHDTHVDPTKCVPISSIPPSVKRITTIEAQISQPGTYVILLYSLLNLVHDMEYALAMWSSKKLKFQSRPISDIHVYTHALHHSILDRVMTCNNLEVRCKLGAYMFTLHSSYSTWFLLKNPTNIPVTVTLDCSNSSNLRPSRGALRTVDTVPPGGCQLLQVLSALDQYSGWSWRCTQSFEQRMMAREVHDPPIADPSLHSVLFNIDAVGKAQNNLRAAVFPIMKRLMG